MRLVACLWALTVASACVIVEGEKEVVVEKPVPEPVPVPVPVPTQPGGGGGGPDSGNPNPQPVPFPGSGKGGDTGTDVLWLVRVDRGTANLAPFYETLVSDFGGALKEQGLAVRATAVASLYDGRLLWSRLPGAPPPVSLTEVLRYHAARAAAPPSTCTTSPLLTLGGMLSTAQVAYPPELLSGREPPAAGRRPFSVAAGAFVVAMLDSGPRPFGLQSSSCTAAGEPAYRLSQDPASWLRLTGGATLARARTRFAFLSTAEGVGSEELRKRCLSTPAFPTLALDALAPSASSFFAPLGQRMNAQSPGLSTSLDLCDAIGGDFPSWSTGFAEAWVTELKKQTVAP